MPILGAAWTDTLRVTRATARDAPGRYRSVRVGDLNCPGVLGDKERQLGPLRPNVLEPLREMSSRECIEVFLRAGIRAVTVIVRRSHAASGTSGGDVLARAGNVHSPAGVAIPRES